VLYILILISVPENESIFLVNIFQKPSHVRSENILKIPTRCEARTDPTKKRVGQYIQIMFYSQNINEIPTKSDELGLWPVSYDVINGCNIIECFWFENKVFGRSPAGRATAPAPFSTSRNVLSAFSSLSSFLPAQYVNLLCFPLFYHS